jgi:Fe-S cluster assembly protein SufD
MPPFLQQTFVDHFEALDSAHPFYARRKQAWEDFKEQGLPAFKDEAYKYTPIAKLLAAHFDASQPAKLVQTPSEEFTAVCYHDMDAYHIVLRNGQLSNKHTNFEGHERFIQVLTFQDAYQQQQRAFLEHFAQHAQSKASAFVALNTALFEGGLFIHIADHAILDKPLLLYHYDTAWSTYQQPMTYPRLLVVAGKYSQASIITSWQTMGFTNAVAEVVLQESAQLDYYTLQTKMGAQNHQINTTQCHQAQKSKLNTYTLTWSGALVRNNLNIIIDAPYSETNMYGLYCLRGRQHVDNCTMVDHRQPHTYSNELYKGIMMGESTGVFNGRIYVRPEAQKTSALQTNNNLVLSSSATLYTKPQLEIWADDVKCSHGATTGQLDEEQIFYLRTRGLHEDTARYLLQRAFSDEVINKIPLATLRTQLHNSLTNQENQRMV